MFYKKGTRKLLLTLQPTSVNKENLVETCRFHEHNFDPKILKSQFKTEVDVTSGENESVVSKVNPSLYKKLIFEDLTSIVGPSEVLEQNHKLCTIVMTLEEENASCKKLLKQTTDLVNTLKEVLNEEDNKSTEDYVDNDILSINSINSNNFLASNLNKLNGLALISIHRDKPLNVDTIINEMVLRPRRLDFVL